MSGVVIQAGTVSGGVHLAAGAQYAVPLPRQLPAGPHRLVDRADELSMLDRLLAGAARRPLLVIITGAPGMGKTAVALWWLHARDDEFTDGQLHADLDGEAVADVLARWLRALGVPPEWIPAAEAELAALWRSATAGRKLAVLVENAASVAGVRMLLPGAGPSVVAVTSRLRLPAAGGDGAQFIHLGPLPAEAAVGLLGQIAGAGRLRRSGTAGDLRRRTDRRCRRRAGPAERPAGFTRTRRFATAYHRRYGTAHSSHHRPGRRRSWAAAAAPRERGYPLAMTTRQDTAAHGCVHLHVGWAPRLTAASVRPSAQ